MGKSFNRKYRSHKWYWGLQPSKLVTQIAGYKTSGTVLDLGAGEGRNALFLAKRGFDVTAVDNSATGVRELREAASRLGVSLHASVADIRTLHSDTQYDIVLAIAILNFMKEDQIPTIIRRMKKSTLRGGLNVIAVFTEDNPEKGFPYLFKRNELRRHYQDWNTLHYSEYITPLEKHGRGKPHRHTVAALIAQCPSENGTRR